MPPSRKWIQWLGVGVVSLLLLLLLDLPAAEIVAEIDMTGSGGTPVEVRSVRFVGVWRVEVAPKVPATTAGPTVYWIVPFVHIVVAKT